MAKLISGNFTKNKLIRETSVTVVGRVVLAMLSFVSSVIVSRGLGTSIRGEYAVIMTTIFIFITIFNFGQLYSNIYFTKQKPLEKDFILGNSVLVNAIAGMIILFIVLIWSNGFNHFIPQITGHSLLFYLIVVLILLQNNIRSILVANDKLIAPIISDVIFKFFTLIILYYYFINNQLTLECVLFVLLGEMAFGLVYQVLHLKKLNYSYKFDFGKIKETIKFSLNSYVLAILTILIVKSDIFFVKNSSGLRNAGIYGVIGSLIDNLIIPSQIIAALTFKRIAEIGNTLSIMQKFNRLIAAIIVLMGILACAVYPWAEEILEIFIKSDAKEGVYSFRVLIFSSIFLSIFNILSVNIQSLLNNLKWMGGIAFLLILNMISNYVLVPKYGIDAAATISLGTYFCLSVYCILILNQHKKELRASNTMISNSN